MTNKEKQLLIKCICDMQPYGVKGKLPFSPVTVEIIGHTIPYDGEVFYRVDNFVEWVEVKDFKPYLRPVSSMTEEEREEFAELQKGYLYRGVPTEEFISRMDEFLNSHHLDFRGFIPMGLALEAPEDMYKID